MALAIPTHIGNSDTTSDVSWPAWPSPPLPPQGGASKRLSDLNSLLRDLSRRVVRVEIGHKPGVFRGTGGSNPVPSSRQSVSRTKQSAAVETPAFSRGSAG